MGSVPYLAYHRAVCVLPYPPPLIRSWSDTFLPCRECLFPLSTAMFHSEIDRGRLNLLYEREPLIKAASAICDCPSTFDT
jgi:hypothetical protein